MCDDIKNLYLTYTVHLYTTHYCYYYRLLGPAEYGRIILGIVGGKNNNKVIFRIDCLQNSLRSLL